MPTRAALLLFANLGRGSSSAVTSFDAAEWSRRCEDGNHAVATDQLPLYIQMWTGLQNRTNILHPIAHKYLYMLQMAVTGSLTDEAGTCNGGAGGCAMTNLIPLEGIRRMCGNDWPVAHREELVGFILIT